MANQRELDEVYMNMAHELSKLSKAERKKVGSIIVKDTQIISEGYNGTPKGFNNDCEYYDYVDEIHTKPVAYYEPKLQFDLLVVKIHSCYKSLLILQPFL